MTTTGATTKSWSDRTEEWLALAHLNFHRAYPWILLAPYIIWLGARFPIEKRGWPWRLSLLLVVGAAFIFAAQEFNRQLSRNLPAMVIISTGEDLSNLRMLNSTNTTTNMTMDGQHLLNMFPSLPSNLWNGNISGQTVMKVNGVTIQSSSSTLTNFPTAKILAENIGAMISTNFIKAELKDKIPRSDLPDWSIVSDCLAYCALIGLAHTGLFYRRYREREQQAAVLENQLNQARLRTLQAQLQPHFLFNALNSIATLVRRDSAAAEEMITSLSELLRLALSRSSQQEIALREEMEFLNRYLEIQQMRFRDRLTVEQSIEPSALDCAVPAILLQPLVENAIRHGIEPSPESGWVRISAARDGARLTLIVEDNGVGLGQSRSTGTGTGLGLANVRERLEALYPRQHEFQFGERPGRGVIVRISIPWKTAVAGDEKPQPELNA